jgi:hypothetical protein
VNIVAPLVVVLASALLTSCSPAEPLADAPSAEAVRSVRVAAVGDIVCDPDLASFTSCSHAQVAALIARSGAGAVMPLGDTQYETGNAQDYATGYDRSWGRFLDITYPVVGNHEYLTPGATGYFGYFAGRTRAPGWYAFNKNGWRMYVLNTECGEVDCGRQKSWLVAQLAADTGSCQALVMHRPRYSSGKHGSSDHSKRFWAVAYREHFELALAGHDHDYERFAKMDHEGRRVADGIRSFVVGTGGASLGAFRATPVPGSVVRYNDDHGALFLDLRPGGYSWRFTTIGGKVIDSGSDSCVA